MLLSAESNGQEYSLRLISLPSLLSSILIKGLWWAERDLLSSSVLPLWVEVHSHGFIRAPEPLYLVKYLSYLFDISDSIFKTTAAAPKIKPTTSPTNNAITPSISFSIN